MNSIIKSVFGILGVLLASLLLYTLILGRTGQSLIWQSIRPEFQTNWNVDTMNDGQIMSADKSKDFNSAVDIST